MNDAPNTNRADLFRGAGALFIWCIPMAILVVSADSSIPYRVIIWPIVLTWMGVACLVNARRCGRRHCYATGPFFLALAVASLLFGLGVLDLGKHGWRSLASILLVGGLVLSCLPEWIWGKYVSGKSTKRLL